MFAKLLAIVCAVPFIAQLVLADAPADCTRWAQPWDGADCDQFSFANNVSTYQFAVVNEGIVNDECTNLFPNQQYCLGVSGEDCSKVHQVQMGDDCDKVADMYHTNATILRANNPELNEACTNLYVGQVVCVDSSVLVPPSPASGTIPAFTIPATAIPASTDLPWCD